MSNPSSNWATITVAIIGAVAAIFAASLAYEGGQRRAIEKEIEATMTAEAKLVPPTSIEVAQPPTNTPTPPLPITEPPTGTAIQLTDTPVLPTATLVPAEVFTSEPTFTLLPIPTNTLASPSPIISIQGVGNYTGQNIGVAAGTQNFNGIEFETGWIAMTQSDSGVDKNKPTMYKVVVQNHIINSSKTYFLWQASWAIGRNGNEIGSINIHISNGQVVSEKIIVGYNIRDWSDVTTKLSAPSAQEAYSNDGGVVDMFAINIPADYNGYEITEIDIQDTSEAMGVHLWAISIK